MIKAIVTDIEGTTSSLSFVKDVLFPYARERLAAFVAEHGADPAVRPLLDEARTLAGENLGDQALAEELVRWIDQDRKVSPLKGLQGLIWAQGYEHGDFHGHVYEDAVRHLRQWRQQGIELYVFSSGSVYAQKLLFGHTKYGDLTPLFSGFFDTRTGAKKEADSYRAIATNIGYQPAEILFLSDIREELDAAHEAGMRTYWLVREGATDSKHHPQAIDFNEIKI